MSSKPPPPGSFRPLVPATASEGTGGSSAVARDNESSSKPPKGSGKERSSTKPPKSNDSNALVKGQRLPPISSASDIPYLNTKALRQLKVVITEANVPTELKDLKSDYWRDSTFVKDKFKFWQGYKKTPRVFPFALLDSAKTLRDRLIVVNWWLGQTKEQQAQHWAVIRTIFSRPQRSSSPLGKWCAIKAAEREAAAERERLIWG